MNLCFPLNLTRFLITRNVTYKKQFFVLIYGDPIITKISSKFLSTIRYAVIDITRSNKKRRIKIMLAFFHWMDKQLRL